MISLFNSSFIREIFTKYIIKININSTSFKIALIQLIHKELNPLSSKISSSTVNNAFSKEIDQNILILINQRKYTFSAHIVGYKEVKSRVEREEPRQPISPRKEIRRCHLVN
jgi:hypothetical protein